MAAVASYIMICKDECSIAPCKHAMSLPFHWMTFMEKCKEMMSNLSFVATMAAVVAVAVAATNPVAISRWVAAFAITAAAADMTSH